MFYLTTFRNVVLFLLVFLLSGVMEAEGGRCEFEQLSFGSSGLQAYAESQTVGPGGGTTGDICISGGDILSPLTNQASTLLSQSLATSYYGINRAEISGTTTDTNIYSNAFATSIWTDMITITGGTGTGTVTFGEQVHALYIENSMSFNAGLLIYDGSGQQPSTANASVSFGNQSSLPPENGELTQHIILNYTFTYDVPFQLAGKMSASGGGFFTGPYAIDASNTAILDMVTLPYGATLISQSGATYPVPSSPVPEPGTMILLGSGLVGLVGYGRRRFEK